MNARFFHVNGTKHFLIGSHEYAPGKSYRIRSSEELTILAMAGAGVVTLTERAVSFDKITEAKQAEENRLPKIERAPKRKIKDKDKDKDESKDKDKDKDESKDNESSLKDKSNKKNTSEEELP